MTNRHNSSPLFHIPIDLIDARNDQRYPRESQERRHNCKSPESASSAESKHGLAVPVAEGRVKSKAGARYRNGGNQTMTKEIQENGDRRLLFPFEDSLAALWSLLAMD